MHGAPGDPGTVPSALARGALLGLFACAGCATGRAPREERATWESPATGPGEAVVAAQDPPQSPPQEPPPPDGPVTQTAPATEPPATETAPPPVSTSARDLVHGSLAVRYRGRWGAGESDHDLGGILALDVADPSAPWIRGHLQGRADLDVDGSGGDDVFGSLSDTYDGSLVSHLYLAYADIEMKKDVAESPGTLRVGRQSDPLLPEVLRLDGVSYLTRPMGKNDVELGAYGGIPVHLYESSREGDRAFGTFAQGRPWKGGRARLDWMHLEDENVLGEGEDDLVAVGLWQDLPEHWRLEGQYSHLEGDPRDLRLRALYADADSDTNVRIGHYELLETQKALVTELDPFYEQLLDHFPYRQTTLNVSHGFGEHAVLDLGIDFRRVSDSSDVGEFNREWERYYATGTWNDLGTNGLALSVTLDRWDDEDRDISTAGADLSYDREERWDFGVGTYFSLYKYEFLQLDERDDVRTYYVRATRDVNERLRIEVLYELEDDDLDIYHTLRLGARWRF